MCVLKQAVHTPTYVSSLQDILTYVNLVCNGFLANVSLVVQSCFDMFVRRHMTE